MFRTDVMRRLFAVSASIDRRGEHAIADEMDRMARQLLLPIEMFPGAEYSGNAKDFIPPDEVPEGIDDDVTLYHVTSDHPGVTEGGLLSREQLQSIGGGGQGLGGRVPHLERPGMVATTYSSDRAAEIHDSMVTMARWLRGMIGSKAVIGPLMDAANEHLELNFMRFINGVRGLARDHGVNLKGIRLSESMTPEKDLGERMDAADLSPEDKYEMVQSMESLLYDLIADDYYGVDDRPPDPTPGFAAPFESIRDLDPDRIRTLRLRARRGADIDHIPQEEQLNFRSWDLLPEIEGKTPEEMALWQQTTYDPRY